MLEDVCGACAVLAPMRERRDGGQGAGCQEQRRSAPCWPQGRCAGPKGAKPRSGAAGREGCAQTANPQVLPSFLSSFLLFLFFFFFFPCILVILLFDYCIFFLLFFFNFIFIIATISILDSPNLLRTGTKSHV